MQFTIGGLGKMEFLEDDVWQLKVLFLEQWEICPSTCLFYLVFLRYQQKAHNPILK